MRIDVSKSTEKLGKGSSDSVQICIYQGVAVNCMIPTLWRLRSVVSAASARQISHNICLRNVLVTVGGERSSELTNRLKPLEPSSVSGRSSAILKKSSTTLAVATPSH
jgi:hypothetical protein